MALIRFPVERRRPQPLLTLKELCEVFGMSERWFRYRVAEGMPVHRYGVRLRFDVGEVERWLGRRYEGGNNGAA